jgi:hypothetical protein
MAEHNEKGMGQHPHKSSEEPWPHREGNEEGKGEHQHSKQAAAGAGTHGSQSSRRAHQGSESSDLKEREYRDEQGNVRHHTRTYEEQHGKEK